mmetsp:Transcript_21989/g.49764  ORF Transcript_21989/g.49764 Transcript_21989/m.49764 type:complete len:213 (-) Transcript_21989:972-1610(-)
MLLQPPHRQGEEGVPVEDQQHARLQGGGDSRGGAHRADHGGCRAADGVPLRLTGALPLRRPHSVQPRQRGCRLPVGQRGRLPLQPRDGQYRRRRHVGHHGHVEPALRQAQRGRIGSAHNGGRGPDAQGAGGDEGDTGGVRREAHQSRHDGSGHGEGRARHCQEHRRTPPCLLPQPPRRATGYQGLPRGGAGAARGECHHHPAHHSRQRHHIR